MKREKSYNDTRRGSLNPEFLFLLVFNLLCVRQDSYFPNNQGLYLIREYIPRIHGSPVGM